MDTTSNTEWDTLTPEKKKRALYERQKALLATFLEHGAISKEQHDKSLHDMTVKMGFGSSHREVKTSMENSTIEIEVLKVQLKELEKEVPFQ